MRAMRPASTTTSTVASGAAGRAEAVAVDCAHPADQDRHRRGLRRTCARGRRRPGASGVFDDREPATLVEECSARVRPATSPMATGSRASPDRGNACWSLTAVTEDAPASGTSSAPSAGATPNGTGRPRRRGSRACRRRAGRGPARDARRRARSRAWPMRGPAACRRTASVERRDAT